MTKIKRYLYFRPQILLRESSWQDSSDILCFDIGILNSLVGMLFCVGLVKTMVCYLGFVRAFRYGNNLTVSSYQLSWTELEIGVLVCFYVASNLAEIGLSNPAANNVLLRISNPASRSVTCYHSRLSQTANSTPCP
jgi:hypothetical protein